MSSAENTTLADALAGIKNLVHPSWHPTVDRHLAQLARVIEAAEWIREDVYRFDSPCTINSREVRKRIDVILAACRSTGDSE